jgi:hypothetical protein
MRKLPYGEVDVTKEHAGIPGVQRYRTLPIELEAICCTNDNMDDVKAFAGDALVLVPDPKLKVSGGGYQYLHFGDWIAKDADGFRLLLTRDINEWFEPIDEDN